MRTCLRLLVLCLVLVTLLTGAAAEVPFFQRTNGWTLEDTPLEVMLYANVLSCMPYDDDRLAMLKQVTDNLSLRLHVNGDDEGSATILVGQSEALTLAYRGHEAQLSSIPEMTFVSQSDPLEMLLGSSVQTSVPEVFSEEAEAILEDGWVLLDAAETALADYGVRKNVKTTITDMGTATTCTDYTLPKSDAETLTALLTELCPPGMLQDILSGLTFSGKQTLRVYRNELNIPLRVEYNGVCGPEDDLRTVKLIWRMRRDDEGYRDEVTLTSPAKSGSNKNTLEFERAMVSNKQGALVLTGSCTYTVTKDKQTTTRKADYELTNAFTTEADVITGEITLQRKLPGEDSFATTTIAVDMTLGGTEEFPDIQGVITFSTLSGKNVLDCAEITVDAYRSETSSWKQQVEALDMDMLNTDELAALQADVASSVAEALVRPLLMLLGDSADWFFRDMLPEQIERITDAAYTVIYD